MRRIKMDKQVLILRSVFALLKSTRSKQRIGYDCISQHVCVDGSQNERCSSSIETVNFDLSFQSEAGPNEEDEEDVDEENYSRRCSSSWYRRRKYLRLLKTILLVLLLIAISLALMSKSIYFFDQLIEYSKSARLDENFYSSQDYYEVDLQNLKASRDSRWLVSTSKCHIPKIDAWHESIRKFVRLKKDMNCEEQLQEYTNAFTHLKVKNFASFVTDNRLYFTQEALEAGIFERSDCCYKTLYRSDDNDNDLVYTENCTLINETGLKAPAKLVSIHCPAYNYTNTHSFVVVPSEEEAALERVAKRKLNSDKYYNVILLGVDTVSRLNGIRQLNKTLDVLRDTYQTIEFVGYNKVGDNTFPNLIPLLTGMRPRQLVETNCWLASNFSEEGERGDDYLDYCKYLWNFYQDLGYLTYFNEDWPFASTFNYLKSGFHQEPTNFYGRPYTLARDKILGSGHSSECSTCFLGRSMVELDLKNLKTFIKEQSSKPYFAFHWINCPQHSDLNGASTIDKILMNFFKDIHKLILERTVVMFFSDHGYRWNDFISTRVGHYENSLPLLTLAMPKLFKREHPDLFSNLVSHKSTLITPFDMFKTLISIRDLGAKRESQDVSTVFGREIKREEPVKTPRGVEGGTNKNLPPHSTDTFALISSPTAITTVQQLEIITGLNYKQKFNTISLLDKHNSEQLERSCSEAGIPDNYCVCNEFKTVDVNTLDALGAAYYFVYVHLYISIKKHADLCHQLNLSSINKVEIFDFGDTKRIKESLKKQQEAHHTFNGTTSSILMNERTTTAKPLIFEDDESELIIDESHFLPNREYNIRLSTQPGAALFQEVIRFYGSDLEKCASSVTDAKKIVESQASSHSDKHSIVSLMNQVCRFSIHSDTISRLNLYNNQSNCVKNNLELKKICYCLGQ